jgi:predicted metal-binding membrane protein
VRVARAGWTAEKVAGGERVVLLVVVGAVAALAWAALVMSVPSAESGHHAVLLPHAHTADLVGFVQAVLMWFVMMVAMMLPPVLPWLLVLGTLTADRGARGASYAAVGAFAFGYFAVWLAYSVAGAALQLFLQQQALMGMDLRIGRTVGAVVLVAAGIYQVTPLKGSCLRHCRNPLSYFLSEWRDGPTGAVGMGLRHGLFCVTCCWALMAIGFALGLMNLLWMAVLTAMLCVEKIAPGGQVLSRVFGLVLASWGVWLLLG